MSVLAEAIAALFHAIWDFFRGTIGMMSWESIGAGFAGCVVILALLIAPQQTKRRRN